MSKIPQKVVSVTMPVELYERLKKLADAANRTVPGYIRQLLDRHLPSLDGPD